MDKDFLHLSFKGDLEGLWYPRQPAGYEHGPKNELLRETSIPRISFSPTYLQCFQAIYRNVSHYFEEQKFPHMDFYVYTPILTGKERIITPDILTQRRMVWDAHITEEHCILDPVKVVLHSKIRILNSAKVQEITVYPYNNRRLKAERIKPAQIECRILRRYSRESTPVSLRWV